MSHPYIQAALARDRQNTLLTGAEAARLAKQVRTLHHQRGTSASRTPPLRWTSAWLPSAWSRLLTWCAESASVASGSRAGQYDRSARADRQVTQSRCAPGATRLFKDGQRTIRTRTRSGMRHAPAFSGNIMRNTRQNTGAV